MLVVQPLHTWLLLLLQPVMSQETRLFPRPRGKAPSLAADLQTCRKIRCWHGSTEPSSQCDLALADWPESRTGRVTLLLFYRLFLFFYLLQAEDVNLHFFPRVLSVGGPQL